MPKREFTTSPSRQKLKALDFFMIRSPSLSIHEIDSLFEEAPIDEGLLRFWKSDPKVRSAVNIASPSLYYRLNTEGNPTPKERQKLFKYVKRMGRRCTPFGSFAGIAIGYWGNVTNLELSGDRYLRARMDMEWILGVVRSLEDCPAVRRAMRWIRPSDIVLSGDSAYVVCEAGKWSNHLGPVRVQMTPMLARALERTANAVAYQDLRSELVEFSTSKNLAAVDRFLDRLWLEGMLVTDLQPPITCTAPIRWIIEKLHDVHEASVVTHQLEALDTFINECSDDSRADYDRVLGQTRAYAASICHKALRSDIQVDMAVGLGGSKLCERVRADVELLTHTLLRISPMPFGPHYLRGFKGAFLDRYGENREVPLLELLDPERGIGYWQSSGMSAIPAEKLLRRSDTLCNIACGAIRDKRTRVEVDDNILRRLELADQKDVRLPNSLELQIVLSAESNAMIDAGKYVVAVGPNVGAQIAGQHFGRFSDLIDRQQLSELHAVAVSDAATENAVVSELTYMPTNFHYANVAVRTRIAEFETAFGVTSGAPDSRSIPPSELHVSIIDNTFRVRWTRENRFVKFVSTHLLNPKNAPPAVQFLSDISRDNVAQLAGFDWGDASKFEFLPRIEYGKLILSLARWRLSRFSVGNLIKSKQAFGEFFEKWVSAWGIPRQVLLSLGDNCLPIDLTDSTAVEDIRKQLLQSPDGACLLQEQFPLRDGAWLRSRDGGVYHSELIVPLGRSHESMHVPSTGSDANPAWNGTHYESLRVPGSEWVYLKLYAPKSEQDDILTGCLRGFTRKLQQEFEEIKWFYVRYADPDPHLRFRVKARSPTDGRRILEHAIDWAACLVAERTILRFSVDVYERELHRYGGEEGTAQAENFFCVDSELIAYLVSAIDRERRELAIMHTLNCMTECFDLDEDEVVKWFRANTALRSEVGPEFRERASSIVSALSDLNEFDKEFAEMLGLWKEALRAAKAVHIERAGRAFTVPAVSLLRSLVHMHCNRAGFDGESEGRIIALLARAREAVNALGAA